MKRIKFSIMVMVLVALLAACGNSDDNNVNDNGNNDAANDNQQEQADTNNNDTNNDNNANNDNNDNNDNASNDGFGDADREDYEKPMTERMDELSFVAIELNVEYGDDSVYELDLKYRNDFVNVYLKDDNNDIHVRGRDGFNEVYPNLEQLNLDQDMDEAEAIAETLQAFDLNDDYTEFELEVEFDDGAKLEIED